MQRAIRTGGPALLVMALVALLPVVAAADSISPATFTGSGPTGSTYTVDKTVTINAGTPTTSRVDVFFLADTTGSMGGTIASVAASASSILTGTSGLGDVNWGVGEYKDFGDSYVYRLNTPITGSQAAVQAGVGLWTASGGGDYAEADLYALDHVATDAATGWRTGSGKLLVWFGDSPGHDPSGSITEAIATADLVGAGIKVEALNVGTADVYAPTGAPNVGLNDMGQAARIASATGGALYSGIDSSSIVQAIKDAIITSFATYSTVCLGTDGTNAGLVSFSSSPCYVGAFDRSIDRTFGFTVTFTDLVPGTHSFDTWALVDGGVAAVESDTIVSEGVPEPSSLVLLGLGLSALAARFRRRA